MKILRTHQGRVYVLCACAIVFYYASLFFVAAILNLNNNKAVLFILFITSNIASLFIGWQRKNILKTLLEF